MIGHVRPAAEAGDDLDAVEVGEPEVDDHEVGVAVGGQAEPVATGERQVDVEVAGAQVGGERPLDLRLVVDHQDPGHASTASGKPDDHRHPAAGGVLDGELAAHRVDEALRDREPEPHPAPTVAERVGTARRSAHGRRPGCPGRGRRPGGRPGRSPRPPRPAPPRRDPTRRWRWRPGSRRPARAAPGRPGRAGGSRRGRMSTVSVGPLRLARAAGTTSS